MHCHVQGFGAVCQARVADWQMLCRAFHMDCNTMCVFVHHLCESAVTTLPGLVSDNRFRLVKPRSRKTASARYLVLEPLQNKPKCYMGTYSRFDRACTLKPSEKREACSAEFQAMLSGIRKVRAGHLFACSLHCSALMELGTLASRCMCWQDALM